MYNTFLKPLYTDIKTLILDTLFPIYCLGCEEEGKGFLCENCKTKLARVHQICVMCQKPSIGGLTHPNCKTPHSPDGMISFFDYHDERVKKLIIHGKYHFVKDIYKTLGQILANDLSEKYFSLLALNFSLCPIPLYWMRRNWRGFNQADVLCQSLADDLNLPCNSVLVRYRSTKTQKDLKKDARKQNAEGVFKIKEGEAVYGQNFILVDDVTTTGATLLEAVKVLKRNGAKKVWCLTIAKD